MSASQREEFHSILKAYFEAKDYKFEKPLGRGSYGLVFKIGTPDGQKYALKISQYDNLFLDKDYQWDDERDEEILPTEVLQFQRELNWLNVSSNCRAGLSIPMRLIGKNAVVRRLRSYCTAILD